MEDLAFWSAFAALIAFGGAVLYAFPLLFGGTPCPEAKWCFIAFVILAAISIYSTPKKTRTSNYPTAVTAVFSF